MSALACWQQSRAIGPYGFREADLLLLFDRQLEPLLRDCISPTSHCYCSVRQASMSCFASFRSRNQWMSRHSLRNVPLKLSTNALSVGLPGRQKSIFAPLR